jgi:hypothetical protein
MPKNAEKISLPVLLKSVCLAVKAVQVFNGTTLSVGIYFFISPA